jgi:hypothetical protein
MSGVRTVIGELTLDLLPLDTNDPRQVRDVGIYVPRRDGHMASMTPEMEGFNRQDEYGLAREISTEITYM